MSQPAAVPVNTAGRRLGAALLMLDRAVTLSGARARGRCARDLNAPGAAVK